MEDSFYRYREVYERSPLFLRNGVGLVFRAMPQRVRHGKFYSVYRRRIADFVDAGDTWRAKGLQLRLLQQTVDFAIRHVPFYKSGAPIRDYDDLKQFPIVSKKDYTANMKAFTAEGVEASALAGNTGGSCGIPMAFYFHKDISRPKEKAHFHWFWGLHGYRPYRRLLAVRGKPLRKNKLVEVQSFDNRLAVSCYELNDSNSELVAAAVRRFQPEFVYAYPSALKVFCQALKDPERLGTATKFRAVLVTSEILPEADRDFFAEFFDAPVVSCYGHSEYVLHGGYLPGSIEYHFFPFYGYLELLDDNDNPVTQVGRVGRIVGTSFDNYVMPFLRYDTGDLGVLSSDAKTGSGRNWPVLKRIEGRTQDIIYLSDGSPVTLTAFIFGQHLQQFKKIREMQFEQEVAGKLLMRIVRGPGFQAKDELEMVAQLTQSVSNKVRISVGYVDGIPKTRRGKHVFLVQKMRDQDLCASVGAR
jgi:phenylacetate-CoA ligase